MCNMYSTSAKINSKATFLFILDVSIFPGPGKRRNLRYLPNSLNISGLLFQVF